jgi:heme-degrading monooxygenase HmoA
MVLEIAEIEVTPGQEAAFEDGVCRAAPLFQAARGYVSLELQRGIEHPSRYRLIVGWETVENHMVDFRDSPAFQQWRALVGATFASPPRVEHTQLAFCA